MIFLTIAVSRIDVMSCQRYEFYDCDSKTASPDLGEGSLPKFSLCHPEMITVQFRDTSVEGYSYCVLDPRPAQQHKDQMNACYVGSRKWSENTT